MRTDSYRIDKYRKKVRGMVLPNQKNRFEDAIREQVEIESAVKNIIGSDLLRPYYIIFAKECNKRLKKYKGASLNKEIEILQDKWKARGLKEEKLDQIKEYLGVKVKPVWEPFRLDISELDGPDRLS